MKEQSDKTKTTWGGKRIGAGRKAGVKTSKNTCVFYAKCTEEEKNKLSEYLKKIRTICVFLFVFIFQLPCFSADKISVVLPSNLPQEITVQSIQTDKQHIIFNLKNTSKTSYYFLLEEAVFIDSNGKSHQAMTTSGLINYIQNKPIGWKTIFADGLNVSFDIFPVENNRVKKAFKDYEKKGNLSIYPHFTYQTALFGKESPIKDGNFELIIPCKNNKDFSTQNLVFKIQTSDNVK